MIIQGSNYPLVIQFNEDVSAVPKLLVTLWRDINASQSVLIKKWEKPDMRISNDTAVCPLSESVTRHLPLRTLVVEIKGLDENGNEIFYEQDEQGVYRRRDKDISLVEE